MKLLLHLSILIAVISLLLTSCDWDPDIDEVIPDRYCSFYRPDYSTILIDLTYKYTDNDVLSQKALIRIYTWSPKGKMLVNDLDGGRLTINGVETVFVDSVKDEGFYPKNKNFTLLPGTEYTIELEHDSMTYKFITEIPVKNTYNILPDKIDMASDLILKLSDGGDGYDFNSEVFFAAINPNNVEDTVKFIDNVTFTEDVISIPFALAAPTIDGWKAIMYIKRHHSGSYDPEFLEDSKVMGTCTYYKEFTLAYEKPE